MGKRGNGEGSIRQRSDGRWEALVSELDPATGKNKRKSIYGKTRKEVAGKLADRIVNPEQHKRPVEAKDTVSALLDRWMASKHNLRPITRADYQRRMDDYIKPAIGAIPLERLTVLHVQELVSKWAAAKKVRTAAVIRQILSSALGQAVKWELIPRNPALAVTSPGYKPAKRRTLSVDEVHEITDLLYGHRLFAVFYMAICMGARRAELCGLRWQDVDLETGRVHVRQAVEQVGQELHFNSPKTEAGQRSLSLPPIAIDALRAHRRRQVAERLQAGDAWRDHDLVFCRPDGSPLYPDYVTQWWRKQIRRTSIKPVSFHDLRHTHATILLEAGESLKVVSERLGHTDLHFTGQVYAHVTKRMEAETVGRLEGLLNPAKTK